MRRKRIQINNTQVNLNIWDNMGQERGWSSYPPLVKMSKIVLFFWNGTLHDLDTVKSQFSSVSSYFPDECILGFVYVRRSSIEDTYGLEYAKAGLEYAKDMKMHYFEVALEINKGVNELWNELARLATKNSSPITNQKSQVKTLLSKLLK